MIVSCLMAGLLQTAVAADAYFTNTRVNFRSGPSTGSGAIRMLNSGTQLEMLEYDPEDWSRVSVNGVEGFVKSEFIRVESGVTSDVTPSASSGTSGVTYQTKGTRVNFRTGPSTDSSSIRLLSKGTAVEMLEYEPYGWSRVSIGGVTGYIKSEFLVSSAQPVPSVDTMAAIVQPLSSAPVAGTEEPEAFRTTSRVRFRSAPSLDADIIRTVNAGTRVTALEHDSDGWSKVSIDGETGYINSEFLMSGGTGEIELLEWSEVKPILPAHTPLQVIDVRSGRSFAIQAFSKGQHADVEPPTLSDTEAIKSIFGGAWTWTPRPVWVNINGRTIAASINGMPHGGGVISGNGMNGQLCLHFKGSRVHNGNRSYEQRLQNCVLEAWNAR